MNIYIKLSLFCATSLSPSLQPLPAYAENTEENNSGNINFYDFSNLENYIGYDFESTMRTSLNCEDNDFASCFIRVSDNSLNKLIIPRISEITEPFDLGEYTGFAEVQFQNGDILRAEFLNGTPWGLSFAKTENDHEIKFNSENNGQNTRVIKLLNDGKIFDAFSHSGEWYGFAQIHNPQTNGLIEAFYEGGNVIGYFANIDDTGMGISKDREAWILMEDSFRQICVGEQCKGSNWGSSRYFNPDFRNTFLSYDLQDRKTIQENWKELGYYRGTIDGLWGHKSLKAALMFYAIYGYDEPEHYDNGKFIFERSLAFNYQNDRYEIGEKPDGSRYSFSSTGTGFAISRNGYMVSNRHVVENCIDLSMIYDGKSENLEVVYLSDQLDLALIKSNQFFSKFFELSANEPELLDSVIVAGYPLSEVLTGGVTVTRGVISSTNGLASNQDEFQIDASIQPGNSGSPVIRDDGTVIGVASYKFNQVQGLRTYGAIPENISFAVRSASILNDIQSNWLDYNQLTMETSRYNDQGNVGTLIQDAVVLLRCEQ